MFKYKLPFYEEDSGANVGGSATSTGEVATPTENTDTSETSTQADDSGIADQKEAIPDGHKPNAAWADMRKKAQKADELEKELSGYKQKLDKLTKALPEGFESVDDYLEALEGNIEQQVTQQQHNSGNFNDASIENIVQKTIDSNPVVQKVKEDIRNKFLVESFMDAQKLFPDIKKAEDIPLEVWDAWNEGASKRTLLSHLKEYRYDKDIVTARKQGASTAASSKAGTAHLDKVQGSTTTSDYESVTVPEETKKVFEKMGIKDPTKQKEYYKKFHRE